MLTGGYSVALARSKLHQSAERPRTAQGILQDVKSTPIDVKKLEITGHLKPVGTVRGRMEIKYVFLKEESQ